MNMSVKHRLFLASLLVLGQKATVYVHFIM